MNKHINLKILLILGFGIVLRTIACFVGSMHFEDVVIAIHLGDTIFKCFFIYQFMRLFISIFNELFIEDKSEVNHILKALKKVFTIIVMIGCFLRFLTMVKTETNNIQVLVILLESVILFLIFLVIELLIDVVFCIQTPKNYSNVKDLIMTNLSDYFWLIRGKDSEKNATEKATNMDEVKKTFSNIDDTKIETNDTNFHGSLIIRKPKNEYKVAILKKINKYSRPHRPNKPKKK